MPVENVMNSQPKRFFGLAAVVLVCLLVAANAGELSPMPTVVDGLSGRIERGDVRGAVIGLYDNGKTSVTRLGELSRSSTQRPDGDTVFEIGSVSKVFTALLAQRQIDAGRAGWDDSIGKHLKDAEFKSSDVAGVTWRELATHSSGLPRLPGNMSSPNPLDPYAGYGRAELVSFLTDYQPGQLKKEYAYSNLGAGLLGELAADAGGGSYAETMKRDVLLALGMTDSGLQLTDDQRPRLAQGFSQGADMPNWSGFDALAGAGAILSTVNDLLRFVEQNLKLEQAGEMGASLKAIQKPQGEGVTALGWHIEKIADDDLIWWHNGGTGGYASFLAIRPSRQTGVVILSASTDYNGITELGLSQISDEAEEVEQPELDAYLGAYEAAPGLVLTIFAEDGQLFGQATGQGAFPLKPDGEHAFTFEPAQIRAEFDSFENDQSNRMVFTQAGRTINAPRVDDEKGVQRREAVAVDAAALKDYEGAYQLAPGVIITIKARDVQLFATLTGQPAYPVFAYADDRFFYKVVDAELRFERDAGGKVSTVVLVQGGEQRAPRI